VLRPAVTSRYGPGMSDAPRCAACGFLAAAVLVSALGAASPLAAQTLEPWDGPAVAKLSRELQRRSAEAADLAYRILPLGRAKQRAIRDATLRRVRPVAEAATALEAALAKIQGPDTSKPYFDALAGPMAEAREYMGRREYPARLEEAWVGVEETYAELAPYYGVDAQDAAD